MATITHAKQINLTQVPDPTQADLDAQIALGNYPAGTLLADIWLGSDANSNHVLTLGGDENFMTDAEQTKLAGIEAGADVTDTANVTAAGALMDSELTSLSGVKTLTVPDNTTISTFGASLVDDASAGAARTTLGLSSRAIVFGAVTPANDTLYLTTYAPFAFTINSVQNIQTSSGTITAAVKINGANITGLSAISVTSTSQDVSASGANTVAIGDEVTVVLSSNSGATNLRGTILITV